MLRHCFTAMGTEIDCLLEVESSASRTLLRVEEEFRRLESMFSRFREDSELSRLNRAGSLAVSEELLEVTELALEARARTRGRFDPTVHDAVCAAGYDRTFAQLAQDADRPAESRLCGGEVTVDRARGVISLGPATRLDFGGIAKGYTVDRTCEALAEEGPCLVNAGGDLAVRGVPESGAWPVGLKTSDGSMTLGLVDGAIATSGRDLRHWLRGGVEQHHLIDPATGSPAATDLLRVTVVASTAVEAEVMAKVLFLAGEEEALAEAEALELPCVLLTTDGRTVTSGLEGP